LGPWLSPTGRNRLSRMLFPLVPSFPPFSASVYPLVTTGPLEFSTGCGAGFPELTFAARSPAIFWRSGSAGPLFISPQKIQIPIRSAACYASFNFRRMILIFRLRVRVTGRAPPADAAPILVLIFSPPDCGRVHRSLCKSRLRYLKTLFAASMLESTFFFFF